MGLRDIKKGVKDSWDESLGDLRKGADSVKGGVESAKGEAKELRRKATKEGRAEAALERQQRAEANNEGRQAALDRAVAAANRRDIRAEEAAITDAFRFIGGQELVTQLAADRQLRRGGFIGSVGFGNDQIWIWRDRIIARDGLFLVDGRTKASVDQVGNLSMAYRHTVTRTVLLSSSWQKKETADTRELFFLVEHPEWAKVVRVAPKFNHQVRQMAANLNTAASARAGQAAEPPVAPEPSPPSEDPLDRIKKLMELRDAGALTEEEFTAQKSKLLNS